MIRYCVVGRLARRDNEARKCRCENTHLTRHEKSLARPLRRLGSVCANSRDSVAPPYKVLIAIVACDSQKVIARRYRDTCDLEINLSRVECRARASATLAPDERKCVTRLESSRHDSGIFPTVEDYRKERYIFFLPFSLSFFFFYDARWSR